MLSGGTRKFCEGDDVMIVKICLHKIFPCTREQKDTNGDLMMRLEKSTNYVNYSWYFTLDGSACECDSKQ